MDMEYHNNYNPECYPQSQSNDHVSQYPMDTSLPSMQNTHLHQPRHRLNSSSQHWSWSHLQTPTDDWPGSCVGSHSISRLSGDTSQSSVYQELEEACRMILVLQTKCNMLRYVITSSLRVWLESSIFSGCWCCAGFTPCCKPTWTATPTGI